MSEEGRSGGYLKAYVVAWIVVPTLLLGGLLVYMIYLQPEVAPPLSSSPTAGAEEQSFLPQIRTTLNQQADLATCRTIVQQLNGLLRQAKGPQLPPLSGDEAGRLGKQLGLNPQELEEVAATAYTPLDAHHLETCFLLRDAARSLEVNPVSGSGKIVRQSPLDRAAAGFAWVVRQVRLSPADRPRLIEDPAPPAAVLRRGHGTPLERALVFLALLEQFSLDDVAGLQGCLLFCPGEKEEPRLWACGVAVGTGQGSDGAPAKPEGLYLFDPRLGLPVPGPTGQGIATLEQARNDSSLLAQLQADNLRYDVTQAQARAATASVVCPLSAAAPRMHFLQDRLLRDRTWEGQALPAQVRVRLAEDPARALAGIRTVLANSDVQLWGPGAGLLRRFLPKEEGGEDLIDSFPLRALPGFTAPADPRVARLPREKLFHFESVPWQDYPEVFRDPETFPFNSALGQQLRVVYATPFLRPLVEANTPRDLMLRGRFPRAVPELVREQEHWQATRRRVRETPIEIENLRDWVQKAIAAYAAVLRSRGTPGEVEASARVADLWKWRLGDPIEVLMNGAIAGPRGADVTYQLALCRHEQAARYQARVDLAARAGLSQPGDAAAARRTWADAEGYWKEYLDGNPGRPGVAAARRLRGEAQAHLGQTEEAVRSWQDLSGPMTDLEKLANRWRIRQKTGTKNAG